MSTFYDRFAEAAKERLRELPESEQQEFVNEYYAKAYIEDDYESYADFIDTLDGDDLYKVFRADISLREFCADFITDVVSDVAEKYSFTNELVEDIAGEMYDYEYNHCGYFMDVAQGGCASGTVGMFFYNCDCKNFYIRHMDDMEQYVEELEGEMGAPIENRNHLPHYTFMCWLCYEEFAYRIGQQLFEDVI